MLSLIVQAPSGLWASLLRRTTQRLTGLEGNNEAVITLGESLLNFLTSLGQVGPVAQTGAQLLAGMGLLPTLLPLLKDEKREHLKLVRIIFPPFSAQDVSSPSVFPP